MAHTIKVLVAPLDWGLGHATRCLPIINELLIQGCEVWLAGHGNSGALLRQQFPHLPYLSINGYNVFYQKANKKLPYSIALQSLKIKKAIAEEQRLLAGLMEKNQFHLVISDNRFGMHSRKAYNIFITHQLQILSGINRVVDALLKRVNYQYINVFDECWIPDWPGADNLAGRLSHPEKLPANARYIGPLSRFAITEVQKKYDVAFILSGPEPLRTRWEQKILADLQQFKGSVLLVRGLPLEKQQPDNFASVTIVNHLPAEALSIAMQQSEWVICRSGYTSVMDLVCLKKKAIMVPTPGQPEQEYLAQYLHQKSWFFSVNEDAFSLANSLEQAKMFPFVTPEHLPTNILKDRVSDLLQKLRNKNG